MFILPSSVQQPKSVTTFGWLPSCCMISSSRTRSSFSRSEAPSLTVFTATNRVVPWWPVRSSASAFHTWNSFSRKIHNLVPNKKNNPLRKTIQRDDLHVPRVFPQSIPRNRSDYANVTLTGHYCLMNTAVKIAHDKSRHYKWTQVDRAGASEQNRFSLASNGGRRDFCREDRISARVPSVFREEKKEGTHKGEGEKSDRQLRITGLVFYSAPQEIMPLTWPKFPCPRTVCNLSLSLGNSHLDSWVGGGGGFSASWHWRKREKESYDGCVFGCTLELSKNNRWLIGATAS